MVSVPAALLAGAVAAASAFGATPTAGLLMGAGDVLQESRKDACFIRQSCPACNRSLAHENSSQVDSIANDDMVCKPVSTGNVTGQDIVPCPACNHSSP